MTTKNKMLADTWDCCLDAVLAGLRQEGRQWVTLHLVCIDDRGHIRVKVVEAAPPQGKLALDGSNVAEATSHEPCA